MEPEIPPSESPLETPFPDTPSPDTASTEIPSSGTPSSGTPPPIRYAHRAPTLPDGPIDLNSLIPGDAPLELDIGFGRGRSFIVRARETVSRVIGFEIKAKLSVLVEQQRIDEGLENGRVVRGDVRELLARAGPDGCVTRSFVHFPDPWWKQRHTKRRVVSDAFLDTLARLTRSGGELYVQTDVEKRADEYEELIAAHGSFEPRRIEENPFSWSNREVRASEDGLPVYRILARRV